MIAAIFWSALATTTLLIGMVLAYRNLVGPRWTGLIMAFGAGAIISAASYQLVLGAVAEAHTELLAGLAQFLPGTSGAAVDAFAAGALFVMLTDSMIPESFEHGGRETGLFLVLGFGVALAMTLAQMPG